MKTLLLTISLLTTPCFAQQPPITKAQALEAHAAASAQVLRWQPTMDDYDSYKTLTENYLSDTVTFYQEDIEPVFGEQVDIEVKLNLAEETPEGADNAQHKIHDPDPENVNDAESQIALALVSKEIGDEEYLEAAKAHNEKRWEDCYDHSNTCDAAYDIAYGFVGDATFYLGEAEQIINDAEADCFELQGYGP